ncbi:hypothetical protein ABBQ32_002660 [Trebouxia sp. C0010 RCD-2024]
MPHKLAHLTVDIAIPSYTGNPDQLEKLLGSSVTELNVSLRVLLQIDQPRLPVATTKYLEGQQNKKMHRLRVRYNASNLGAGETRNQLLDASSAQYIIFFDDDVTPTADCINAYIRAARQQPEAPGFAGMLNNGAIKASRGDAAQHCSSSTQQHAVFLQSSKLLDIEAIDRAILPTTG